MHKSTPQLLDAG